MSAVRVCVDLDCDRSRTAGHLRTACAYTPGAQSRQPLAVTQRLQHNLLAGSWVKLGQPVNAAHTQSWAIEDSY